MVLSNFCCTMKLVVLGLFLVVNGVFCEVNQSSLKDRLHGPPTQHCSLQCEAQGGSGPNWLIRLDLKVYLAYNAEHQYFGLVNVQLGISILYRGGLLVVTNTTSGSALVMEENLVWCVNGSGMADLSGAEAIYGSFEDVMLTNHTGSLQFGLMDLMRYLTGEPNVTQLEVLGDFGASVQADFRDVFVEVHAGLRSGAVPPSGGAAIFFGAIFHSYTSTNAAYFSYFHFFYVIATYKASKTQLLADALYNTTITGDFGSLQALGAVFGTAGYLYTSTNESSQAIQDQTLTYSIHSVSIDGRTYWFTFYHDRSNENWTIHIVSSTSRLYIIYYKDLAWVYFNPSTSYALVFPSSGNSYAFYNCTSGVGLVISKLYGKARVETSEAGQIAQLSHDGSYKATFALITSVVSKVDIGFFDEDTIFFPSFLSAIYDNGEEYQQDFPSSTRSYLNSNFKALMVAFHNIPGYNPIFVSANVLLYFFHGMDLGGLPKQLVVLAFAIATKASGLMNVFVMGRIFASIEFGVSFHFKSSIFADVLGILGGSGNATQAVINNR